MDVSHSNRFGSNDFRKTFQKFKDKKKRLLLHAIATRTEHDGNKP